uniref:TTC3/DZIP3/RBM44-like helical domain-containing protein n=1 Tax=Otus sunia TaxID=257818 RepID=A0A8C8B3W3_9STRI
LFSYTYFNRCNGNNELGSSLMLVLEELKKSYNSMRMKIKMGVPLNALTPLSVEMKVFQVSFSYVPCCVKNEERNEYWFDAKEDLTVADFSVTAEEMKKQQEKQDMVDLRGEVVCFKLPYLIMVFVYYLSGDLRSHFQKYWISDPVICVDSGNYRYINISFTRKVNNCWCCSHKLYRYGCYLLGFDFKHDTGENFPQKTCAPFSTNSYDAFISPDTLNLSSFNKVMKNLQAIHPEASRDKILNALLEVRRNNQGILSGLSISSIVEWASVILKKSTPSCGLEKHCK